MYHLFLQQERPVVENSPETRVSGAESFLHNVDSSQKQLVRLCVLALFETWAVIEDCAGMASSGKYRRCQHTCNKGSQARH